MVKKGVFRFNSRWMIAVMALFVQITLTEEWASASPSLSLGQTLYVPVYSHIYFGDRPSEFNLAATLSIRNIDPLHPISVIAADYYDSEGRLVKRHMLQTLRLGPLVSSEIFIAERDRSGGFGAAFIVRWVSETPVNPPLVECVMIGARSGQGISFVSTGRVIADSPK
jgi:hypothetical protein